MTPSQIIKKELQKIFPSKDGWKFSVTADHNSITVAIMTAPIDFLTIEGTDTINHYYLDRYENEEIFRTIYGFFSDWEYSNFELGKWNKPFQFVDNAKGQAYIDAFEEVKRKREEEEARAYEVEQMERELKWQIEQDRRRKIYNPETDEVDLSGVVTEKLDEPYFVAAFDSGDSKLEWLESFKESFEEIKQEARPMRILVDAVTMLTKEQWHCFTHTLMNSRTWLDGWGGSSSDSEGLPEDKNVMDFTSEEWELWKRNAYNHAIKVVNMDTMETIYVDPQGRDYARYIYFEPQAKLSL